MEFPSWEIEWIALDKGHYIIIIGIVIVGLTRIQKIQKDVYNRESNKTFLSYLIMAYG